jgi:predicted transcriptional regulator
MEPVFRLTNAETRLAELLWENAPIASMEMIKLAEREFGWKKSTTFTNLKFLIDKGLAKNEKSCVTMLYTRDEIIAEQSRRYVDDTFGGSLPMFIAAYTSNRKLPPEQVAELKRLIDEQPGNSNEPHIRRDSRKSREGGGGSG